MTKHNYSNTKKFMRIIILYVNKYFGFWCDFKRKVEIEEFNSDLSFVIEILPYHSTICFSRYITIKNYENVIKPLLFYRLI